MTKGGGGKKNHRDRFGAREWKDVRPTNLRKKRQARLKMNVPLMKGEKKKEGTGRRGAPERTQVQRGAQSPRTQLTKKKKGGVKGKNKA